MTTFEAVAITGMLIFNGILIICLAQQRTVMNHYKKQIRQNMIALKQARKLLEAKNNGN